MQTGSQSTPGRNLFLRRSSVKKKPAAFVLALMATALLLIGVGRSSASNGGRRVPAQDDQSNGVSRAAIENFWTIYHGNDYPGIPEAQRELETAIQSDPNNPTLYALLGATHFWHVGEMTRDPNALADKQIFGQEYQDQSLIAKGNGILDFAVYQFPEFNNFNRWAAHLDDARDTATYQKALDSLWQDIDACIGTHIDRANPDMKPYLGLVTGVGRKKACWWKGDIAPYAFEGLILNLGNGLVKAGQIDAARVMYANAKYADNYETWPYRSVLESIAASDLNARAALYAPGATRNPPPLNVPNRSCVYCHATLPETASH